MDRSALIQQVRDALRRSRVVALLGPRQCGKTTIARQLVPPDSANYFDLEDPHRLIQLENAKTVLEPLQGVVVIDEVQHRPELFPHDLQLERIAVVYPGTLRYTIADRVEAVPLSAIVDGMKGLFPGGHDDPLQRQT